jgi:hypothetical protein
LRTERIAEELYKEAWAEVKDQTDSGDAKYLWDMKYEEVVSPVMDKLEVVRSARLLVRASRRGIDLRDVGVNIVDNPWVTTDRGRYLRPEVKSKLKEVVSRVDAEHRKESREKLSLRLAFIFGLVGAIGTLFTVFYSRARIDSFSERVRQLELTVKANGPNVETLSERVHQLEIMSKRTSPQKARRTSPQKDRGNR